MHTEIAIPDFLATSFPRTLKWNLISLASPQLEPQWRQHKSVRIAGNPLILHLKWKVLPVRCKACSPLRESPEELCTIVEGLDKADNESPYETLVERLSS